jgi:UDP-2,3-diacylglucosamine hydrolase
VFQFSGTRWLLTHGDALCLDDRDYLAFRAQVREPAWQQAFLARPLAEREAVARGLRAQSEAAKQAAAGYADVDAQAATEWLEAADAAVMIHGHTHKPREHALPGGRKRIVLSDWDALAAPARMEALRIAADGSVRRLPLA